MFIRFTLHNSTLNLVISHGLCISVICYLHKHKNGVSEEDTQVHMSFQRSTDLLYYDIQINFQVHPYSC